MKYEFTKRDMDMVDAIECAEEFIKGELAFAAVNAIKHNIEGTEEFNNYENNLIRLLQKTRKACNITELEEILTEVLELKKNRK